MKTSELFNKALDEMVNREEVATFFKKVLAAINDVKAALQTQSATNLSEMKRLIAEFEPRLIQTESRVTQTATDAKNTSQSEARTLTRMLRYEIDRVQNLIQNYDDSELRALIDQTRAAIPNLPAPFDSAPILTDLQAIKDRLDALDTSTKELATRPAAAVSNLRIQQAFKYILKTEAPTGSINGSNKTYTLKNPIYAILSMSINGEIIAQLPNYTINGNTFTFGTALSADYSGSDFEVKYI